jgi:hypothetical protein
MKFARLLVIGTALLAAGCAAYTAIDASKPVTVGNKVTVTPQIAWAQAASPGVSGTVWTADGVALDALMFFTGIAPGQPLIKVSGVDKKEVRAYQAGMVPDDVMELLASNIGKLGYRQIATSNLRPAPFGKSEGFRFDLTGTTGDGLEMKGVAIFTQRGGKLDLILFIAPNEYYFGRYSETVERIFASIQAG